jgi:predicted negative regulator of RcsB-dependent stress response
MRSPARLALALTGAVLFAGCGSPPAGQTAQDTQETVVVVPPQASATATGAGPEGTVPDAPARKAAVAGDVEECIAKLRSSVSADDQAKMGGEADYHDALAAEREGKLDRARRGYLKVVQDNPSSVFVPAAYFAFGEMFAAEAQSDPSKVALAEQSYNEVLKFPPAVNKLWAVSSYRLGVVLRTQQPLRALSALARAAKAEREAPQNGCAAEVSLAALAASIPVFVETGSPAKSFDFYVGLAGDRASAAQTTLELAERYVAAKKRDDAAACLAASVEPGAKAQPDAAVRAAYCERVKQVAGAIRAGATKPVTALDKALAAACP